MVKRLRMSSERNMLFRFLFIAIFFVLVMDSAHAADDCNPIEIRKLTTPVEPPHVGSTMEFESLVVPEAAEFVVLGDSIARQIYRDGDLANRLGYKSSVLLAGVGDGIQHSLFKMAQAKETLKRLRPRTIFMSIGTNNTWSPSCALKVAFKYHMEMVHDVWPNAKVYVMYIMPRGPFFQLNDKTRNELNSFIELNQRQLSFTLIRFSDDEISCGLSSLGKRPAVTMLASNYSAKFVECGGQFIDKLNQALTDKKGTSIQCSVDVHCENFRDDNVHLSRIGIAKVVNQLSKAMSSSGD
jgi:hypothetical protein